MRSFIVIRSCNSFLQALVRYSSLFSKLVRDSIFRFMKDSILIIITGVLGSFFQISAIGQVIYCARALETGKTFKILGHNIDPRSADFFFLSIASLLLFLIFSSFLLYYSNSKIIKLCSSYETFCSKKVFSIVGYLQGICSPGMLSLYDKRTLLRLAGRDARLCGRILRRLITLVQPTFTFVIALGALFYINSLLTVIVLLVVGVSMFFHYKNNLKGASSFRKMENHAPGAKKEKHKILQAAMRSNDVEDGFFDWMDRYYIEGEIEGNLEGFRRRFQTLENARFINNILVAILLSMVALILGGKAIIGNAHWGALIVYLLALRYCLSHLQKNLVMLTSINRLYPIIARYFSFVDSLDLDKAQKDPVTRRQRITVHTSPFHDSLSSINVRNGDTIAIVGPFDFDFYKIPMYIDCLFGHEQGLVKRVLRCMQVVTESNGYLNELSLRELFHLPRDYHLATLHQDLQDLGFNDNMIGHLPDGLDRPVSRDEWDRIEPEIRYSLGLFSAVHSGCQWVVIDEKVLHYFSRKTTQHLFKRLKERIILIVFDGELGNVGTYGEKTVAVIDGQNLIGLGDVDWFESQKRFVQEQFRSAEQPLTRFQEREEGADDFDDDELDDDI